MPVDFSIKQVPDDVAERVRERARRHHRSLQGELRAILEAAVEAPQQMTADDVVAWTRSVGLQTPPEAVAIVRAGRDERTAKLAPARKRAGGRGGRGR